jgi:hypothetical protein
MDAILDVICPERGDKPDLPKSVESKTELRSPQIVHVSSNISPRSHQEHTPRIYSVSYPSFRIQDTVRYEDDQDPLEFRFPHLARPICSSIDRRPGLQMFELFRPLSQPAFLL